VPFGIALLPKYACRIGFGAATRTQTLVDRTKSEVAGTLLTAQLALQHGLAVSTAGGTHHAFADAGSGFCILNDLAYTAHWLLAHGGLQRVLILDLDVHQVSGLKVFLNKRETGCCRS
jgi:acetoin utilization deacetylase AcuC-like enzyme